MFTSLAAATRPARFFLFCTAFLVLQFGVGFGGMGSPILADDCWLPEFGPQGTNGEILAVTMYNGQLIMAGYFSWAGDLPVAKIACWDGDSWSDLDGGMPGGLPYRVSALAVFEGELIAAGRFYEAGGVPASNIARWDGNSWAPLQGGTNSWVSALLVHDGRLYVGGHFTEADGMAVDHLAVWDGTSWHALGPGPDAEVMALSIHDGDLIAGGQFLTAGGVPTAHVARWDGAAWHALEEGLNDDVHALAVHEGCLIAGGAFWRSGEIPVYCVGRWDGDAWENISGYMFVEGWEHIDALAIYNGELIVGGFFWVEGQLSAAGKEVAGGAQAAGGNGDTGTRSDTGAHSDTGAGARGDGGERGDHEPAMILRWTGSNWRAMDVGFDWEVNALVVSGDELFAAGAFTRAGFGSSMYGRVTSRIARWSEGGLVWHHVGRGTEIGGEYVNALTSYDGDVIAGGQFWLAGGGEAKRLARWNGYEWLPLGAGVNEQVFSLAVHDGDLIAGGQFIRSDTVEARGVARWDGVAWHSLGDGLDYNGAPFVYALRSWDGDLIAAGGFFEAGGQPAANIARWDGAEWHAMGFELDFKLYALAEYEGDLIVAKGREGGRVFRWQGDEWVPMGAVFEGFTEYPDTFFQGVYSLTVHDGDLLAGGKFLRVGETEIEGIARWDGSAWVPFASTPGNTVRCLAHFQGDLIAAGDFPEGIARWDGDAWCSFDSGMNAGAVVKALCPRDDDVNLFVAGDFEYSGDMAACYVARWSADPSSLPDAPVSAFASGLTGICPNPFRAGTTLSLVLGHAGPALLTIHDLCGRQVRTVLRGAMPAGEHCLSWDGRDHRGVRLPPGVYCARLRAGAQLSGAKLLLLK